MRGTYINEISIQYLSSHRGLGVGVTRAKEERV